MMSKKASKPKTKPKAADANAELRAMLERLQEPEYVMQVIRRCQEYGLIPKDAA